MRLTKLAAMALCIVTSQAHAQQDDAPKVSVGVVSAERKPISKAQDFVGRVDAVDRVEIRARVTGFLDEIEFKEGDTVKEGDPLYRIEKGLFQAAVGQAEGALERSKAAKVLTEVQLQRAADLLAKNVGSVAARDQAERGRGGKEDDAHALVPRFGPVRSAGLTAEGRESGRM